MDEQTQLSRRERQIMDIIYARGEASATQVVADMSDPPSRTAVRTMLRILEQKGHLRHSQRGREYVYRPATARAKSGRSATRRLLETFFGGSIERAVAAYFSDPNAIVSDEELKRVYALIKEHRRRGE